MKIYQKSFKPISFFLHILVFNLIKNRKFVFASFFSDLNIIRKWGVISIALFSISLVSWGQVNGDYQTRAPGNWNDNNTWQVYSGVWVNCLAGDYPGVAAGAGTVYIAGNYTVSVTANIPNSIGAINFVGANATNIVQFSGAYTLNIIGAIAINPPTVNGNNNGIYVNSGFVTCTSLTSLNSGGDTRDCKVAISVGTLTVNGNISMGNNVNRNDITYTGAGTLNVTGNLTTGQLICVANSTINIGGALTPGAFTVSTSTVNFNGAAQQVSGTTYYNLIISGGNVKTLVGATLVNGTLTLSSGVLQLNAYNLTLSNTLAIAGAPFGPTKMIETNSTGQLIRSANATNQSFNLTYPVGSGGYYSPFIITGLPNSAGAARYISVGAIPTNLNIVTNSINKYWDLSAINITTAAGTVLSFAYNAGEVVGNAAVLQPVNNTTGTWAVATGPSAPGINPATSTGSTTITGSWSVGAPAGTYYSYQTGLWNAASTWTSDPGGTTGPGTTVPSDNDKVVILSERTVSLSADVTSTNLDVTINSGGILDQSTFRFTNTLTALKGAGILKLSSSNYPVATTNTFVTTDQGTTEYNNSGTMSATQAAYYHLIIRSAGTVTMVSNVTLNGNLDVKQGTFQINDAVARRLQLLISGNVTVDGTGLIAVGTGNTVTGGHTPLTTVNGGVAPFINYYDQETHRVVIQGDFTNNGSVKFTNQAYPEYSAFPVNGAATIYFQGSSDNLLSCNGITDFYNLVLDKGTDQTFKLTINSSAYNNFRLFGANIAAGDVGAPATTANPNLKKALWIRTGTLELQGLTVIPSLSEGAIAGPPSSDFFIPANGALLLNGGGVIVLSTSDDYQEVNGAYGVAAPTNASMGINAAGGNSGLSILGKLQVNDGYLSTRESSGILYWNYASGQFILNGGTVDTKQFHSSILANSLISYTQTGGNLQLRGRFQRITSVFTPAGIISAPLNTTRVTNGVDGTSGSLSITNSGSANSYSISGGNINIFDVCGSISPTYAFQVLCASSGINVTGGTLEIDPTTGSGSDANYLINTTAPINNLIINRASGAAIVQLNTNPLIVKNDLTLTSGVFDANSLDVTIGGNYSIAAGTTYTTGTNTTTFNGSGNQAFTVDVAAPLTLNKLTIDKTAGISLNLAGSQSIINVSSDFSLVLGTLNDNGNTVNIAGDIYNSGIHTGIIAGKISLNGTVPQSIDGDGVYRNVELNNTNAASAPVSLAANMTINGTLTFSQDKLFNIGTNNLTLNSSASIAGSSNLRYITSAGNVGDGGLTKVYASPATFTFPIGVVNYTPASIGLSSAPTAYGSITVIPVNFAHPNVTTPGRSLSYFWRTKSTGFTLGSATVTHGYSYDETNVVTGAGITEVEYVAARFDVSTSSWTSGNATDVDETANIIGEPGAGNFLESVSFIDGDYTAGDNNPTDPFGVPQIFYSRINGALAGSGLWSNVNTWSLTGHSGAPAGTVPGVSDIVIIGAKDSVYLATNNTVPNTDVRSCASLKIEKGSALDIGYNPNSSFGIVQTHANGNGNFRFTTSWTDGSTYVFPFGDFSDFNVNLGATELYSTNPAAGTTYWLPNNISSYGNLILSPLGGSNIIFGNTSLTIYGNLVTRGQNADSWFCPTWVNLTPYPTAPTVPIAKTITINGNLEIQGGALIWIGNGALAQDFVVYGDVIVAPWGSITAWTGWGGANNQSLKIGGSLINNTNNQIGGGAGSTTSYVNFSNGASVVPVTFFGPNNASITSTTGVPGPLGPRTIFNVVTIDKGTTNTPTLTIDIDGILTTPTDNWLTLQNGTLRYMRTDPGTDFAISTITPFSIPSTAGLYINLSSNTGNRNILIGNASDNAGDLLLSGKLTIINGNVYLGRTPGTDVTNNDIEYTTSGASEIEVQGGSLVVNGQIRRDPLNAGGILKYNQSGGTVTINGQASNGTNAKLEVLNTGSDFTMSNGTLTIVRGNGSTVTTSSPFGDLYLRPQTGSVTGGTIIFSQGVLGIPQNYFLDANIQVNNLTITGTSAVNYSTVRLLVSPLILNGNMTINANSVLNSNDINITFNGNLINTPGVGGYLAGTNITTFSATNGGPFAGAQTITGTTNFYDMVVNPGTSYSWQSINSKQKPDTQCRYFDLWW